jgi:hypothetical protein
MSVQQTANDSESTNFQGFILGRNSEGFSSALCLIENAKINSLSSTLMLNTKAIYQYFEESFNAHTQGFVIATEAMEVTLVDLLNNQEKGSYSPTLSDFNKETIQFLSNFHLANANEILKELDFISNADEDKKLELKTSFCKRFAVEIDDCSKLIQVLNLLVMPQFIYVLAWQFGKNNQFALFVEEILKQDLGSSLPKQQHTNFLRFSNRLTSFYKGAVATQVFNSQNLENVKRIMQNVG